MIKISKYPSIIQRSNKNYINRRTLSHYKDLPYIGFNYRYHYNNSYKVYGLFFDQDRYEDDFVFNLINLFSNIRMTVELEGYTIKDEIDYNSLSNFKM